MITTFTTRKYAGNGRIEPLSDDDLRHWLGYSRSDRPIEDRLAEAIAQRGTDDERVRVFTYEGAVLAEWERTMHDDSDFYASVWDEEEGRIKEICWGTTRGWTYWNGCSVDATPEVIEKASAVLNAQRAELAAQIATSEARVPSPGRRVVTVNPRARKVPVGTEGVVFWRGEDSYRSSRWGTSYRIGFRTEDGTKHFVPEDQVEVVDPETFTAADFPQTGTPPFHRIGETAVYATLASMRKGG